MAKYGSITPRSAYRHHLGSPHTWGSALTHRPYVHMIAPGGGISLARGEEGDSPTGTKRNERWMACREVFFLPVRVLSRLFGRLFLDKLAAAHAAGHHAAGQLTFFGDPLM